jgi:hypothetical protein
MTPALPGDRRRDMPTATFRKPSRTIRVEPIRRPAKPDRADDSPAKLDPKRSERPAPTPRRTPTPSRP